MKYIGIIGRKLTDRFSFNKEIIDIIFKNDFIPVGIIVDFNNDANLEFNKVKPLIDMCSKIILQGGSEMFDIDILIVKYLHEKDIPTLGICLGMQTMAMAFDGIMKTTINHNNKNKYAHNISIDKSSKLYDILKKTDILVNSRHNDYISKTKLDVSSYSNVIESIEDKSKKFFIGVQWHPESIMDENSILLFKSFFLS